MARALRPVALVVAALALLAQGDAQAASKLRSKLPVVVIKTNRPVPNEPKVAARVRVVHRGNEYAGRAGIETRGHSSQLFPKKQYGIELRDRRGEGRDVSLLGLPEDDDWVLSANYNDKSLLRNVTAYRTARTIFGRWAPRTRHVEVVLNGNYRGVYVLTQRIGIGEGRVDAEDGWILELVFGYQAFGERHFTSPRTRRPLIFTDPDEPTRREARRIRRDVGRFEAALYGKRFRHPRRGWRARLDRSAAVDYVLLQELFGNQDAFHASTYFHRAPGERIAFGPLWDFDIAMGNTTLDRFRTPPGWHLGARPYVGRLYRDAGFVRAMAGRWREVRRMGLRKRILAGIARDVRRLARPQRRNFARWQILGRYVWPNPVDPRTGGYRTSWRSEVGYLRRWLAARIRWMDRALPARARR